MLSYFFIFEEFFVSTKKTILLFVSFIAITITLISCGSKKVVVESIDEKMPKWIYHFDSGSKTCGVGTALPHIKGISFQRAVAIARAIDEIARQKNVTVNTKLEHFMSGSSEGTTSNLSTFSVQTTSGVSISSKIKDAWMSQKRNEFYVLLCTN